MADLLTALVLLTTPVSGVSAPERLEDAKSAFERLGFETTMIAGGNLSISGKQRLFEKTFDVALEVGRNGVATTKSAGGKLAALPLAGLPPSLKGIVKAIAFEAGLDFGPTDF